MITSLALQYELARAPRASDASRAPTSRAETTQMRLNSAARAGDVTAIARALSEPARRLDLDPPLRLAAKGHHCGAVRFLLERGASLSRAFSSEHAPTRVGKRNRLVEFLASPGADGTFILTYAHARGG